MIGASSSLASSGARVVLLDDAQRLVVPAMGGLAAFDELLSAIGGVPDGPVWVLGIDVVVWHFLVQARSARPEQALDTLEAEPADKGQQDALSSLISGESREQAGRLLAEVLDETERTIMALHFGNGLELGRITRLLGLTNASGARAYVQSAKRKLSAAVVRMRNAGQI